MTDFLIVMALSCAQPIMENRTQFPWNENDYWNLETALPKCQKLYPKSPCIKKFIKLGERDYRVICSKEI
jgi:uncharacterized protein (DUF1778 family)